MAETVARRPVRSIAIVRHPLYAMLLPIPVVCFIGALLADVTYLQSGGNLMWLAFATWFLFFGLLFGAVGALVLLIDFIRSPGIRGGAGWAHLLLFYAALLAELLNILIHQRDGWTAVADMGLILSIIGVALILIAGWLRRPATEVVR
jgi:uncharacterized membrane protein